jgi:hypothetical protein
MPWFAKGGSRNFRIHVLPRYAGKKTYYLEIGVFRGDGLEWMLEHVLTHPRSRAWAVDPWLPLRLAPTKRKPFRSAQAMEDNYKQTVDRCKSYGRKAKIHRGMSSVWLRQCKLPPHWFDVIYLDGDHYALPFLDDLVLTWPLLKVGGMLLIDDYRTKREKERQVKSVVDCVMQPVFGPYIEQFADNMQVGYVKTGDIQLTTSATNKSKPYFGIQTK